MTAIDIMFYIAAVVIGVSIWGGWVTHVQNNYINMGLKMNILNNIWLSAFATVALNFLLGFLVA